MDAFLTDATWGELLRLALGIAAAAGVAGFLAGLLGIGGGAILVPVLYQALAAVGVDEAVRMHLAVGTSLGIIVPTSIRSVLAHKARGAVDFALLKSWVLAVPLGVGLASLVAASVSGEDLRLIFALIAIAIGTRMLLSRDHWVIGRDIPGNPMRAGIGALIGFLSTLMGIGGGVLNNTFMTLFGRPIHQAVATSAGVGVLISIPGVIGFMAAGWGIAGLPPFSIGYVNLLGIALVIPVTFLTAPLGAAVTHRLKRRTLEIAFGVFLFLVAARFLWTLL